MAAMMSLLGTPTCTTQPSATTRVLHQNTEQPLRIKWLGQGNRSKTGAAEQFKAAGNSLEGSWKISDRDQRARAIAQAVSPVLEKHSIPTEKYPGLNSWQTVNSDEWESEMQLEEQNPTWLNGTYLINGPGYFHAGDHEFPHLFDGYSTLVRLNFDNGTLVAGLAQLQSDAYNSAMSSGKVTFRVRLALIPKHDNMSQLMGELAEIAILETTLTDNANTGVIRLGDGRVVTEIVKGSIQVDPTSNLKTAGRFQYEDKLGVFSCLDVGAKSFCSYLLTNIRELQSLHEKLLPDARVGRFTVPLDGSPKGRGVGPILEEEVLYRPPVITDSEKKLRDDADEAFRDYQFLYRSQRNEVDSIPLTLTEGAIPADLTGVYFLCGPGILSDDHGSQVHPLDGHGYLRKFVIKGATSVTYSAKYVDTEARKEEFDEENKTWKFTYRGPFSLLRGGGRFGNLKVMKNVANTSVLQWAGHLLCLYEGGQPYEIESISLRTLGVFKVKRNKVDIRASTRNTWKSLVEACSKLSALSGAVRITAAGLVGKLIQPILKGVFAMPEERMLSHVKYDVKRQRLVAMTCRSEDMVLPKSTFTTYEMDKTMKVVQRKVFTLNEHLMIHDWGLTDNHYVLLANRIKLNTPGDVVGSLAGMAPMINCLALDDSLSYTPLYLLPRGQSTSKRDWRIPVKVPERLWFIHTANSSEETDNDGNLRITVDGTACSYNWFSLMHMFGYEWQKRWLDPTFMNASAKSTTSAREMKNPVQLIRISTCLSADGEEIKTDYEEFENNSCACDFPAFHPQLAGSKNEHTYLAGASGRRKALPYFPFDSILKISGTDAPNAKVRSWSPGNRNFVGEPVFVPRAGAAPVGSPDFMEDDGYLITVQYAAAEEVCYFVILDSHRVGHKDAVLARLRLPAKYAFPYGFHGAWTDLDESSPHNGKCSLETD